MGITILEHFTDHASSCLQHMGNILCELLFLFMCVASSVIYFFL